MEIMFLSLFVFSCINGQVHFQMGWEGNVLILETCCGIKCVMHLKFSFVVLVIEVVFFLIFYPKVLDTSNLVCLFGLHERYLNNLLQRFDEGLINDFYR